MTHELIQQRIAVDDDICFGKPHVKGTRIKVSFILELLASNLTIAQIVEEYPQLDEQDVVAALDYSREILEQ